MKAKTPRVCLIARSVSSDVLAETDMKEFVQAEMAVFVGAFVERLSSAKQAGEFPAAFDPNVVPQVIGTYLQDSTGPPSSAMTERSSNGK